MKMTALSRYYSILMWALVLTAMARAQRIHVGDNVQVSKANSNAAHYELIAAVDPANPRNMLVCSILPATVGHPTVVYASEDGGVTWALTLTTDKAAGFSRVSDPACEFGLNGSAYYAGLSEKYPPTPKVAGLSVFRSTDGGRTWGAPFLLPDCDRPYFAVDRTTGPRRGTVYINATTYDEKLDPKDTIRGSGVGLFTAIDGEHFVGPVSSMIHEPSVLMGAGNSVVLSDGTLVVLFGVLKDQKDKDQLPPIRTANASLNVAMSDNGGMSLSKEVKISDWFMDRMTSAGSHLPVLAVDPGSKAFKDRLYAVWDDARQGRLAVMLSYSIDKGKTWSEPRVVNDDRAAGELGQGPDTINPEVAVSPEGIVGVSWADRRDSPDNKGWWYRFSASLDGGETFLPSVKVSSAPNTFTTATPVPVSGEVTIKANALEVLVTREKFLFSGGDALGIFAIAGGTFFPVWTDNRTGISQIWTAPVTVSGDVVAHGAADLARLDDLSGKLSIETTDTTYDRVSGEIAMTVQLKNSSKQPIWSPVKIRVRSIESEIAVAAIANADNSVSGAGAIWDFTPELPGGELQPGQQSKPKILRFKLSAVRPITEPKHELVKLDAIALGRLTKLTKELE